MINRIIRYFLQNRMLTILVLLAVIIMGIVTAPFNWKGILIPRNPVPVDAIPNLGDNQQIVATEWMGRSPQDIQDQITYPLTTSLLGIPGVKSIRSTSMFGMSFIYIIFKDDVEFYWSRSRILEKLNSLSPGLLPDGVQPALGPDATALGQIFWYTLEGRNPQTGKPAGGWNPEELRTIQDFYVKYTLSAADGVSEVASAGGFIKEYQIDLNPDALRSFNISVMDVMEAVKKSNEEIGAETVEINMVEYLIRGLGYIKSIDDIRNSVIMVRDNAPVKVSDVAFVTIGPATRRGGLDKDGIEAVGGVVVARFGSNPLQVINNVKAQIAQLAPGLPEKTLPDGTVSKVTVVPFYDRTALIRETIGTLETAISHEILISIIVIIVLVLNLRASIIISSLLPLGVLMTFILMRYTGIEANIVALSGIAIAIGVMVDVGIVFDESILRYLEMPENRYIRRGKAFTDLILKAVKEVSGAIATAMTTTVVSFLPVFLMQGEEGRMFTPLAFTKTYAIASAFILGLVLLPTISYYIFSVRISSKLFRKMLYSLLVVAGIVLFILYGSVPALGLTALGINNFLADKYKNSARHNQINILITLFVAVYLLAQEWLPMGPNKGMISNFLFVGGVIAVILLLLWALVIHYERILHWCLDHRWKFMMLPLFTILLGLLVWKGTNGIFGFIANGMEHSGWKQFRKTAFWNGATHIFPGIGEEFMPTLNEGSFLLMPSSMPHSGIAQNLNYIEELDQRIAAIPEVETVVGKWGRVASALDPAPIQMFENTILYRPEYMLNENGDRIRFKVNRKGEFALRGGGYYNPEQGFRLVPEDSLIPARGGDYFRQWRPEITNANQIWQQITQAAQIPGLSGAPKLQPIAARLMMLSTGMRSALGIKIFAPDLASIEKAGQQLENALREVSSIIPSSIYYDRSVGAPYLEIQLDREKMARYGINVANFQEVLSTAIGGMPLTTTVEGRERFPVRVRYAREFRDNPQDLGAILIPTATGTQIPMSEVAEIHFAKGARMIQSENTFLTGTVTFDRYSDVAEVDVVKEAASVLEGKIKEGTLVLPKGTTYKFAGSYEQQSQAARQLLLLVPITLLLILLILYFQFKSIIASLIHFSGVFVAFAGGFILLWLYGQEWFFNFSVDGVNMRELFQMHTVNLSVAVWIGFIALFGISTDDGVLMGTYIHQVFLERQPKTREAIREAVIEAGKKRVRPAAMTTATALIALLPVLTSTGKGAEIMVPMAIPTFGGMLIQSMTMFVVPVFQCWWRENAIRKELRNNQKLTQAYEK